MVLYLQPNLPILYFTLTCQEQHCVALMGSNESPYRGISTISHSVRGGPAQSKAPQSNTSIRFEMEHKGRRTRNKNK